MANWFQNSGGWFLEAVRKPGPDNGGNEADDIEDDEHRRVACQHAQRTFLAGNQAAEIDHDVPEKKLTRQLSVHSDDQHLHPQRDDKQRLVIIEADAVEEKRPVKIPSLVRRINPTQ